MRKHPCRCGEEMKLEFRDEVTEDILIKDVPVLVCTVSTMKIEKFEDIEAWEKARSVNRSAVASRELRS